MDEGVGKSADIDEWMKELLPEVAADAGVGRGVVTVRPSNVTNSNQQIRTMGMGENYQVPAITPNNNPGVWQHSQRTIDSQNNPVRQNMTSNLPALFEEFSQSQASRNMISKLHQQQQLQNQVLGQVAERPNIYQFRGQPNMYANNIRQHQQQPPSLGGYTASHMMKQQEAFNVVQQTDQMTLQKSLEAQRAGFMPESMHPRLQMPVFHQSQNLALVNQLKPGNQSQTMHLGQSQASESTPQVDLTNSIDWINQAFQKLVQIKDTYLPDVIMLFNKAREDRPRATTASEIARCEKMRNLAEKLYKFLNLSKSDLLNSRKEKMFQMMDDAVKQCIQIRAMFSHGKQQTQQAEASGAQMEAQQRENYYQSLRQAGALSLPESSVNSSKVDAPSIANAMQFTNPMRATQKWASPGNMVPSPPQKGSQMGFDQRSLRMLLHPPDGASQHINMGTPQQMVATPRNIFNSLDYSINPMAQSPLLVPPQNKQQDQAMKRQKMKQPVQQMLPDKNKQQMLQKRNDDTHLRRLVGINQKMSPLLPSCSSPYALSPQNSQQSSSQLVQKDLSLKLSKSGTPPLSTSPSAFPSPLTPLTPSSTPADYAKSPLSLEESSKLPKTSAALSQLPRQDTNQNQLVADAQGLSKSCLLTESTCPDDKQSTCVKGDPIKRLVEAVKSISSRALTASLQDIDAVTSLTDRVAEHHKGKSSKVVCKDLVDEINDSEIEDIKLANTSGKNSRIKHQLETVIFNNLTTETEYCPGQMTKRMKTEPNDLLLQEIKEVNHKLLEMAVDVIDIKDVSRPGFNEGTLIRCSYNPIGLGNTEMPNTSKQMFPNLVLEFIVAPDYPSTSPTVLETIPPGCSDAEGKDLWVKAKTKFSLLLRKLPHPISVKDMAEAWDVSTREAFLKFAEQRGGGSFSTLYGKWEDCVLAV